MKLIGLKFSVPIEKFDESFMDTSKKRKKFTPAQEGEVRTEKTKNPQYDELSDDGEDILEDIQEDKELETQENGIVTQQDDSFDPNQTPSIPDSPSIKQYSPVGTRNMSDVYEHFYTGDNKDSKIIDKKSTKWKCKHCNLITICDVSKGTGNLWSHLRVHYIYSEKTKDKQTKLNFDLKGTTLIKEVVEKANYYLGKVIVNDMRTFSLQVSKIFILYSQTLSPQYSPPSEETMSTMLFDILRTQAQPKLKQELALVPSFSLTTDGWKSRTKVAMQTIEIHYVHPKTNVHHHRILEVKEVNAESVDHLVLIEFFDNCLKLYGIKKEKILCFVVDGGANQWLALKRMNIPSVWCGCHSIAVVVKKGLGTCDAYTKPKILVTWFNSSSVHTKSLRELQKQSNLRTKLSEPEFIEHVYVLIQETDTRWNSWFLCIKRIILLWPEIRLCLSNHEAKHLMNDQDIEVLEEFSFLLEPFYISTLTLEKENSTLSDILCEVKGLMYHLKDWKDNILYKNTKLVAEKMLDKINVVMNEYLGMDLLIAAVILDRSLGSNWKKIIELEMHQEIGMNWIRNELSKLDPK